MYTPKTMRVRKDTRPVMKSPADIKPLVMDLVPLKQEHMYAIAMDAGYRVIERYLVAVGGTEHVCVDVRSMFRKAIELNATYVCCVHNHPNGDPTPSSQDLECATRIQRAGSILGIHVLDSLVIAKNGIASMAALPAWQDDRLLDIFTKMQIMELPKFPLAVPGLVPPKKNGLH